MSNDDPAAAANISARLAGIQADLTETLDLLRRNITARGADPYLSKALDMVKGAVDRVEEADDLLALSEGEFTG